MREILEIREAISRSSTAKYQAFELRSRHDGRARDNTIFFGAHTGRQAGTGLQPQNLFKTVIPQEELEVGIKLIRRKDRHTIEALFEKPMDLYASAIRSCIVAAPNCILDVGDFATIEVRVLFWLAGHAKGLKTLADGRDLYLEMASYIYGLNLAKLAQKFEAGDSDAKQKRQLGKQTVLGAGFGIGIGGEKFQATCKQYGIAIGLDLARSAIQAYRKLHAPIPGFWTGIEKAARLAILHPGKAFRCGFLVWKKEGEFLTVKLPMGRKLSYYKPRIDRTQTLYGERLQISYLGVVSQSKKFLRVHTWGGKLTENVVQAVARDLVMEALLRLEKTGIYFPVLAVHDEIVGERNKEKGSTEEFEKIMSEVPEWASGLPIKVEAWSEDRYRK